MEECRGGTGGGNWKGQFGIFYFLFFFFFLFFFCSNFTLYILNHSDSSIQLLLKKKYRYNCFSIAFSIDFNSFSKNFYFIYFSYHIFISLLNSTTSQLLRFRFSFLDLFGNFLQFFNILKFNIFSILFYRSHCNPSSKKALGPV